MAGERVLVGTDYLWKCEMFGCESPELVQGLCHHHCVVCPKCGEHPCNGLVDEPICNVCIMAFRPRRRRTNEIGLSAARVMPSAWWSDKERGTTQDRLTVTIARQNSPARQPSATDPLAGVF